MKKRINIHHFFLVLSDYKYNLNVIYFVPKNVTPNPDYEERLSKILIEGQNFFSKWMKHWGFGDKTYGLLKNKENTRIKSTAYTI